MEKRPMRAGIVGSGFAAEFHFDALQRVYSTPVDIAGAYSPNQERLSDSQSRATCRLLEV
jgi:predicted dehydrogenase